MVIGDWEKRCLKCGGTSISQPCYPIEGLDVQHYYSKEEYLDSVVDVLWQERLDLLEKKGRGQSAPAPRIKKKPRRKGGISL